MIARTALVALLLVLGVAACGDESGSSGDPSGSWTLTSASGADGEIEMAGSAVTLEVNDDGVSGQAPCNTYQGLSLEDGEVSGAAASTMMACEEDVMDAEAAYFVALGAVDSYEVDGDTLTLTGPDVELTFERS